MVIAGMPHGEPKQIVLDNEFSLCSERLRVVVRNHQLLCFVINKGLMEWDEIVNQVWVVRIRKTLTVLLQSSHLYLTLPAAVPSALRNPWVINSANVFASAVALWVNGGWSAKFPEPSMAFEGETI